MGSANQPDNHQTDCRTNSKIENRQRKPTRQPPNGLSHQFENRKSSAQTSQTSTKRIVAPIPKSKVLSANQPDNHQTDCRTNSKIENLQRKPTRQPPDGLSRQFQNRKSSAQTSQTTTRRIVAPIPKSKIFSANQPDNHQTDCRTNSKIENLQRNPARQPPDGLSHQFQNRKYSAQTSQTTTRRIVAPFRKSKIFSANQPDSHQTDCRTNSKI